MNREKYDAYLKSSHWRNVCRGKLLCVEKDEAGRYQCESCEKFFPRPRINIHHKHYNTIGKERNDDLEVLCETCHEVQHGLTPTEFGVMSGDDVFGPALDRILNNTFVRTHDPDETEGDPSGDCSDR